MRENSVSVKKCSQAFSLVEVVLAIGVLSLAVVALLGLFGPTMSSVKQVIDTNEATAVVSRVNAEIQRALDFDTVFTEADGGAVYYVWKEQDGTDQPVTFRMEPTNAGIFTALGSGQLVGSPFVVTFSKGLTNSDYWNNGDAQNTEGYVPVLINIFAITPERMESGTDPITVNDSGVVYSDTSVLQESDLIFSYTTAKTRSI